MPRYKSRTRKPAKKKAPKLPKKKGKFTRDPRKLLRWAARGSHDDYERLRALAKKARAAVPAYIDSAAYDKLTTVNRTRMLSAMIAEIQEAEQHNISGGFFSDALSWVLDKVPFGNWLWPVAAAQGALKAHKGDNLNEVDEEYARLVGAAYEAERPYVLDHWRRQTQFDSQYISVWDNLDGHRVITIRGTKASRAEDIGQDILVGLTGHTTNRIGAELRRILDATPEDSIVDLAAHSMGTSLALESYNADREIYNRIHETYMFNPSYSPFMQGVSDQYEGDENVRYFINLGDVVSIGGIGHSAPANVVFHQPGSIGSNHSLAQWQGSGDHHGHYEPPPEERVHPKKEPVPFRRRDDEEEALFYETDNVNIPEPASELDVGLESASDYVFGEGALDFGADTFSEALASI